MIDGLIKQNIRLKNHDTGPHKTTCPRCSHTRKDKKDPCLWVNIQHENLALWKCHNCFWTGAAGDVASGEKREEKREYKKPEAPATPAGMPANMLSYIHKRGITDEVIKRNRLYHENHSICFPYYVHGELINVKYRTVDKKFRLAAGARLVFYGYDDCRGKDEIIIVEGEFDKLALEVCGLKNVLSVPNGAPARVKEGDDIKNTGAFEYLGHAEEMIHGAKKVIIAVDNDKAGHNLKYELARRIGIEKCWIVEWPHKDANDTLLELGVDVVLDCIKDAKPHPIKGLYRVDEFENQLEEYFTEGMKSGVPTGWDPLDKLYTIMPGELDVITGVPNSGKSEFLDALMINLARNEDWKFVIFSPEHRKEHHVSKLVEKIVGKPTSPVDSNRMALDEFMSGASWISEHFYFIVSDDDECLPTLDWSLEKASQAIFRYGCNAFVLDPWNEIEHDMPNGASEHLYIGKALAKIKRWQRKHNVKVWIVAHPTKIHSDKDGKMRVPSLYDIAGSSNWANKIDNGIVIHRSEDAADSTEIYLKKVRNKHVGRRGMCSLKYDKSTGQYSVPSNWKTSTPAYYGNEGDDMVTFDV